MASREIFGLSEYVAAVEALDNVVDTATQTSLCLGFRRLLDRASRWFVHNRPDAADVAAEVEVERFRGPVQQFAGRMGGLLPAGASARPSPACRWALRYWQHKIAKQTRSVPCPRS